MSNRSKVTKATLKIAKDSKAHRRLDALKIKYRVRGLQIHATLTGEEFEAFKKPVEKSQDMVFCQNCQQVTAVVENGGLSCATCGENICVYCGCTETETCAEGCYWVRNGVCSECKDNV